MKSLLMLALAVVYQVTVAAHPGHDETVVVTGTVVGFQTSAIEVATFDMTLLQPRTVSIVVDGQTKYRLGRQKIEPSQLELGVRVVVSMKHLNSIVEGGPEFRAMEIRASAPKNKTVKQ